MADDYCGCPCGMCARGLHDKCGGRGPHARRAEVPERARFGIDENVRAARAGRDNYRKRHES